MQFDLTFKKTAFNDVYFPFLVDYSKRYEVYYGGAGSGKSVFVTQKLIIKALQSKRKILVIRKFGTTLKDSVFQLVLDMLKKWQIYDYCKINNTNYTITLPNDSVFLFKGLDDSEKIKSITDISDIWVEESTEITADEFTQLDLRLRANTGDLQLFCSFNPVSKANWVYKKWFISEPEADTRVLKTTYKDNRFLPESYIKALEEKQKSNINYYKIYALGEFCSLDKLVFNNWRKDYFNITDIKGSTLIGLDFGFVNDVSALVASILDEANKKIYVFKEWGSTGKTNSELAQVIKSLGFSKSIIIADSAEQKSIEELRQDGITRIRASKKGQDSVIHGIQQLQNYEIVVNPECTGIITELENYAWTKDKATNEYINKPIDSFNHYIDALRYSLQCVGNQIKIMDKNILF